MKRKNTLLLLALIIDFAATSIVLVIYPSRSGGISVKEGYLFTFAHITDSHLPKSRAIAEKTVEWLARQENIRFVVHTGDIVDNPFDEEPWENAYEYMHRLDNSSKWSVLAGNHDVLLGRVDLANYEEYFGNDSIDQYFVVEDRMLFILLGWNNLDGSISKDRLEWMDEVIQSHEKMHVVICLHPHLFGLTLLNISGLPNYEEMWSHIDKHENVIMTLSGHIHINWVHVHSNGIREVWSIGTEALMDKGYIRLFDVYEDRIEVYAYSPWTNQTFSGTLDRFTMELNPNNHDADGDLWGNNLDMMPTHPLVPNGIFISSTIAIALIVSPRIRNKKTTDRASSTPLGGGKKLQMHLVFSFGGIVRHIRKSPDKPLRSVIFSVRPSQSQHCSSLVLFLTRRRFEELYHKRNGCHRRGTVQFLEVSVHELQ